MTSDDVTGNWVGHYQQGGGSHPISADLLQAGEQISGVMRDGEPLREFSLFESAVEAGLPPGADEQLEAQIRAMVTDAPAGPVRCVTQLPPDSLLQGRRRGANVSFLKTYQGVSFGGYRVGDQLVGIRKEGHAVHYEGRISDDGLVIDGRWWIDAEPETGARRCEGLFTLQRSVRNEE